MKRISTLIFISILFCSITGTVIMAALALNISKKEIKEEANNGLQLMAERYSTEMSSTLSKYEGILDSLEKYIVANYDMTKVSDKTYNDEFLEDMNEYIYQFSSNDSRMLGIYMHLYPELNKYAPSVWYIKGDRQKVDPVKEYELFAQQGAGWEWFYEAYKEDNKKSTWLAPYYDEVMGQYCISYTNLIYIDDKLLFAAGLDIEISEFDAMVNSIQVYDTGYASLLDRDNQFIVGKNHESGDKLVESGYTNLAHIMENDTKGVVKETIEKEVYYVSYSKMDSGFTFAVTASEDEIMSGVKWLERYAFIVGSVIAVSVLLISIYLGRSISKPIVRSAKDMQLMEQGDFTGKRYKKYIKKGNEIGILARALEAIQISMGNMLTTLGRSSNRVENSSKNIHATTFKLVDQVNSISGASEELASNMQETANRAERLHTASESMDSYIQEMSAKIHGGMGEVTGIKSKTDTLKMDARASTKEAEKLTNETRRKMSTAIEESKKVAQIQELTNTILEIASQTSLLALNASIEAARAGEAGKGFAVVAGEISKLATSSQSSAQKIQDITAQVIQTVNTLSETSTEMLYFMETNMKDINTRLLSTSDSYSNDADYLSGMLNVLSEGISGISNEIETIVTIINDLKYATKDGAEGTNNIAVSIEEISENSGLLQEEVKGLKEVSIELTNIMTQYKI